MFPLDYALALSLLVQSPDTVFTQEDLEPFHTVRPVIQSLAIGYEILDPREVRYVLKRSEDFAADLKLLRKRFRDYEHAPPLHDAMMFPDRTLINELLEFNRAYVMHVRSKQELERVYWWELRETICETERLYKVWDTARDARCDYYYVTVRRAALQKLRSMLGYQAYYAACLPPHVPVWRFGRID